MTKTTINPIIAELEAMAQLNLKSPRQSEFFKQIVRDAKPVQLSSVYDVFTMDEVRTIKRVIDPQKGKCYRNAALMTELFPDRCKYVEGFGYNRIIRVEHAFNRVGDKYVDITWELALGDDVTQLPYVALIEADRDTIIADIEAHNNYTGDFYLHKFLEQSKP